MTTFSRFLRSAPLGVFGSTAERVAELTDADDALRAPTAISRRIGFVQTGGGSGASTTAAYVASMLARRRAGYVLGVDASAGSAGMLWHAGLPSGAEGSRSARRSSARRVDDAVDGLPRTSSGLWALDLGPLAVIPGPASAGLWYEECSPITRFFDVVVTDWGVRTPRTDLARVAEASHVVCLVARADRHAAEAATAAVEALRGEEGVDVVVALVDVGGTAGRAPGIVAAGLDVPVVAIPYDAARGAKRPVPSENLATRTRIAYTRLATELLRRALRPAVAPERTTAP